VSLCIGSLKGVRRDVYQSKCIAKSVVGCQGNTESSRLNPLRLAMSLGRRASKSLVTKAFIASALYCCLVMLRNGRRYGLKIEIFAHSLLLAYITPASKMQLGQAGLPLGAKGQLGRSSSCSSLLHTPKGRYGSHQPTLVTKSERSVYLRVSAACLPNFFKSRSNVSRSFFERTPATSSIAAACSPNPRVINARPFAVSSTWRTRRSSG